MSSGAKRFWAMAVTVAIMALGASFADAELTEHGD